jgi:outer membrane lipoprotein LolB
MLAGCVGQPAQPGNTAAARALWAQRQPGLRAIDGFTLQGRIGGGLFRGGGAVWWQQHDPHFTVRFSGALGVGAVLIEGTPDFVSVRDKDGTVTGGDVALLLQQRLGWTVPLSALRSWVVGLPEPGSPAAISLDDQGRLRSLDQDGWHLEYLDYVAAMRDSTSEVELPHRMALSHTDQKVRVVIDRWLDVERPATVSGG